jgi:hypothetical protein
MRISGENDAVLPGGGSNLVGALPKNDPELQRLLDAWPTLPAEAKASILKLAGLA